LLTGENFGFRFNSAEEVEQAVEEGAITEREAADHLKRIFSGSVQDIDRDLDDY